MGYGIWDMERWERHGTFALRTILIPGLWAIFPPLFTISFAQVVLDSRLRT